METPKCKSTEHLYIPITWESYQQGLSAIQKALAVMCEKCLDIKYITEAKKTIPEEQKEATIISSDPIKNENKSN